MKLDGKILSKLNAIYAIISDLNLGVLFMIQKNFNSIILKKIFIELEFIILRIKFFWIFNQSKVVYFAFFIVRASTWDATPLTPDMELKLIDDVLYEMPQVCKYFFVKNVKTGEIVLFDVERLTQKDRDFWWHMNIIKGSWKIIAQGQKDFCKPFPG